MKKSQTKQTAGGTQWSAMFGDIFGLKALADKKGRRDKKRIPWQWALWGALLFFIVGYLLPTDSIWILLVAVAAAVIFYFAKSTETVEEQVLLLTDSRTPAQKEAHARREAQKAQRKSAQTKRPAKRQSARTQQTQAPAAEAQVAEKPTSTQSTKVRKPKAPRRKPAVKPASVARTESPVEAQPQITEVKPVAAEAPVAEVAPAVREEKEVKTTTRKPRAPRKRNTNAEAKKTTTRKPAARRPRKPKAAPALTQPQTVATTTEQNK